jgi:hypothetical protein
VSPNLAASIGRALLLLFGHGTAAILAFQAPVTWIHWAKSAQVEMLEIFVLEGAGYHHGWDIGCG